MRSIVALALAVLLAPSASAQLIAVHFKDQKTASRYKDHLVPFQGEMVVIGEAWTNLKVDVSSGFNTEYVDKTNHYFEILRPDRTDPSKIPYKVDGEDRKVTNGKLKVGISTDDVTSFSLYMREGSLQSLAADYGDRKDRIDELRKERDAAAKGSPEWMAAHQKMLQQMERLQAWLSSSLFAEAGEKYEKEVVKERKVVAAEATAVRLEAAKGSVKTAEPDEKLVRLAQEIGSGSEKFKVQQSTHCRIIYREGIEDLRVQELLILAEEIINGWRVDFVDPYLDLAYEDYIEDKVFGEWFFAYDDIPHSEKYMTAYYGMTFDPKNKEESLKDAGHGQRRTAGASYVYFWRAGDDADLEGMVAHNLGHMLAGLHYDKGKVGMQQDWLEEGCGLYISLEWLGRNSVNCKAFAKEAVYAHEKRKAGEKTPQLGLRDWYNSVALEAGVPIDRLALKTLFEMGDGELAKSWSFFDFIAKKGGKEGQLFLRAACNLSHTGKTFIPDLRRKAEEIYDIHGKDVFGVLEARWKEYAQAGQDTGDTKRK